MSSNQVANISEARLKNYAIIIFALLVPIVESGRPKSPSSSHASSTGTWDAGGGGGGGGRVHGVPVRHNGVEASGRPVGQGHPGGGLQHTSNGLSDLALFQLGLPEAMSEQSTPIPTG